MKAAEFKAENLRRRHSRLSGLGALGRKECRGIYFQRTRQNHQFDIRHTTQLRFDLREGGAAQFQSKQRASGGKQVLRQSLTVAQFPDLRPHHIFQCLLFSSRHAPRMEPDTILNELINCSIIGAMCELLTKRIKRT